MHSIHRIAASCAACLLIVACSSSSTSVGTGASTSIPSASTTTVATTPGTTLPATASTTTVPAPVDFTLRGDGIGPFDLGVPASELIDAFSAQFGPPTEDVAAEYPNDDASGGFLMDNGEVGFIAPFGRTVCWAFDFCADFGGNDATTLFLTGWTYGEDSGLTLTSTSGVTIGTRWSDVPAITVSPGGCYTVGYGTIDGIELTLLSDGVEFTTFDAAGNYIENTPPPEQVSVTSMQAGDIPIFLFGDC